MRKLSIVTLCVGVATTFHALSLMAQEPGDASRPANLPMPAAAEEGKETHQLPDGYGAVVTRGQRRRIYGSSTNWMPARFRFIRTCYCTVRKPMIPRVDGAP